MKRIIPCLLILLVLAGCKNDQKKKSGLPLPAEEPLFSVEVDSLSLEEELPAPNGGSISLSLNFPLLKVKSPAHEQINRCILRETLGPDYGEADYQQDLDRFFEDQLHEIQEIDPEDLGFAFETYYTGTLLPLYQHYLSYLVDFYLYTGGAHGNHGSQAYVFDCRNGQQMQLKDFFRTEDLPRLGQLLSTALERTVSEEDKNMIFAESVEPTENFYLDEKGITFLYNPYELGAYALGEIDLLLPWEQLDGLFRP